jgi:dTDP-4-dehydrorhamnose reductase
MRCLVTGAGGQLGGAIVRRFTGAAHEVIAATRQDLDITRHAEVLRIIDRVRPDVIINCAAFNDVEGAESQPQPALDVNAFAVRSLARGAAAHNATLVHYSTDFVFDGALGRPYTEDDRPRPSSVYASAKYLGEGFARDAERHYVIRVESLFGGHGVYSSVDRIIDRLLNRQEARAFVDRVVSPSYVVDVAAATEHLLARGAAPGLYHCVNSGYTTWFELAREIARQLAADERLVAGIRVADVQLKAKRPMFAALANDKLTATGIAMPTWQDAIARHIAMRRQEVPS